MAIPPELDVRIYVSRHHFTIVKLERTNTRMVVQFEQAEELDEFLDKMVTHYEKRSGIDVDKRFVSVVFLKREVPNVPQTSQEQRD